MKLRAFAAWAFVASTGCAAMPGADDAALAELRVARRDAAADQLAIRAMQDQNRLLVDALMNERAAAAERAELTRRLDALERANAKPADATTAKGDEADKNERVAAAASPAPTTPTINTTDVELSRLRAKLAEAGFGPVTLTPAQVRALLRALRPPRPIDAESPFAL